MEKYKEYKDSGVQWLGEIPSHWIIKRLASMFTGEIEVNKDFYVKHAFKFNYGELVPKNEIGNSDEYKDVYSKYSLVNKGDIVINGLNLNYDFVSQRVACTPYDGIITSAYIVCRPRETVNYQYYTFLFKGMDSIKLFHGMGTGIRLTLSFKELRKQLLPLPPLAEQHSIVSFLDTKCTLLDTLLSNKEKEISLLQEMKQRVIADAVTRGVNPNVKFKATNIPWLPEIPEHWEMRKMKYIFKERSEKNHPNEEPLCATQSKGVIPQSLYEGRVVVVNKGFENLKFVKEGDFVISLRSFQGGIEYAYFQGIISAAYTILEIVEFTMAPYYKLMFKSHNFIQLLQTCVTGIREGQNINYPLLSNKTLPVPPLSEQRAIVSYITERTSKIDTLIEKLTKEIGCVKEYKQRLISDVVTGQVKVC